MMIRCWHIKGVSGTEHICVTGDGEYLEWYTLDFDGTVLDQSKHIQRSGGFLHFYSDDRLKLLWAIEL